VIRSPNTDDEIVDQSVSVRGASGKELWHFTVTSPNGAWEPMLAPDSGHALICCTSSDSGDLEDWLVGRDGRQVILAAGFSPEGWLDTRTMIGVGGPSASAGLTWTQSGATQFKSIKVTGDFLGTVRP
jgi:hypothetical protein